MNICKSHLVRKVGKFKYFELKKRYMHFRLNKFLILILLTITHTVQAQEHKNGFYADSSNNVFIKADRNLYFYVATDTSEVPHRVNVKNGNEQRGFMQISKTGVHHVKHFNRTTNKIEEITINVDGIPPRTTLKIENNSKALFNGVYCYDKTLKISLHATDNMSKVRRTYFSINNAAFQEYSKTLIFNKNGNYSLKYYSCDNVGNIEKVNEMSFAVDISKPTVKLVLEGRNIDSVINAKTLIKLVAQDNAVGIKNIYYQLDGGKWTTYNGNHVNTSQLNDDYHTVSYYAVDRVNNKSDIQNFVFYLDKKAPLASLISLGDKYVFNNKTYFSGRTKLVLIALDNKSGVDSIMCSSDNQGFEKYENAFYLASSPGTHTIKYYAIDKLGNKGAGGEDFSVYEQKSDIFTVDLLGPDIFYKIVGNSIKYDDHILINEKTRIQITAHDKESGVKSIKYSIGSDTAEVKYTGEMNIAETAKEENFKLKFSSYDNVNNRNVLPINFVVDAQGPEIFHYFSVKQKNNENVSEIPAYAKVFLAAKDSLADVKDIKYSINGGQFMEYRRAIKQLSQNTIYNIKVIATDNLSNKSEYNFEFKTK